jgi:hypothetical protein
VVTVTVVPPGLGNVPPGALDTLIEPVYPLFTVAVVEKAV